MERTALTLTRKDGEAVSIDGGRVVVRVQSSRGGRTSLRIEAPREVRILREELTKGVASHQ